MKQATELVLDGLRQRQPALTGCMPDVCAATECIARNLWAGGRILVCGNGGSAVDSLHIVSELMKGLPAARVVRCATGAVVRGMPGFCRTLHCKAAEGAARD